MWFKDPSPCPTDGDRGAATGQGAPHDRQLGGSRPARLRGRAARSSHQCRQQPPQAAPGKKGEGQPAAGQYRPLPPQRAQAQSAGYWRDQTTPPVRTGTSREACRLVEKGQATTRGRQAGRQVSRQGGREAQGAHTRERRGGSCGSGQGGGRRIRAVDALGARPRRPAWQLLRPPGAGVKEALGQTRSGAGSKACTGPLRPEAAARRARGTPAPSSLKTPGSAVPLPWGAAVPCLSR